MVSATLISQGILNLCFFLAGMIPLEEIPALVRAVGFYPSEEEVMHMINEIRYKSFMVTGETQDYIGLDEFIRLYVNHCPVIPLER
jgi:Ca2+-binding EF-hand superfamily protein